VTARSSNRATVSFHFLQQLLYRCIELRVFARGGFAEGAGDEAIDRTRMHLHVLAAHVANANARHVWRLITSTVGFSAGSSDFRDLFAEFNARDVAVIP
jgi:hypothetical protein